MGRRKRWVDAEDVRSGNLRCSWWEPPLGCPGVSSSITWRASGLLAIPHYSNHAHSCSCVPQAGNLLGHWDKTQHIGYGCMLLLSSCCLQPSSNGNYSSSFPPFDNCLSFGGRIRRTHELNFFVFWDFSSLA